ncbi:MAG: hypothetical protein L6R19_01485 [Alphaproteobacteria bacterium]|nr:hypothetical protein [Alphaproteobacteria bacterium]
MYRIGVILCRGAVQRWQRACIEAIEALGYAEIALVLELDNPSPLRLPVGARAGAEVPGDWIPPGTAIVAGRAAALDGGAAWTLRDADRAAIAGHTLDVLLDLTGLRLAAGPGPSARHGVWGLHHGDPARFDGRDPGFREVATGALCSAALLYRAIGDDAGGGPEVEVLREGWFKTRQTPRRNADSVLLLSARLPALVLRAMAETRGTPLAVRRLCLPPPASPPRARDRFAAWAQVAAAMAGSARRRLCRERWTVGVVAQPVDEVVRARRLDAPRWLANQPDDRFYADPFPLGRAGGRLEVLVEAARYAVSRGYLARLELDERAYAREAALLETPEHLSYPAILNEDGATYVIPESWQTGRLAAYRLDAASGAMVHDGDLMVGMAVVDPTLLRHDGKWWLFCCDRHDHDQSNLYVFHAASWRGPWLPHAQNPVKIDVRSSRPAGAFLSVDGALYRPAQDCALRYGSAIAVNRVLELTERRFREEVAFVLRPDPDGPYPDGLHTINGLDGVTVVDGQKLSFEPLAAIADRFARRRNRRRRDARA